MKIAANIVGGLLGFAFIAFSLMFFLNLMPQPKLEEGSPVAIFMGVFAPSGWLAFVKGCELIGGILTAIPKTRNFGLLFLGPVILNILACHIFIEKGAELPMPIVLGLMSAFLLWAGREKFLALKN